MFSFLNFNDIGATTANKSTAFKKIRANAKVFTTNLVATPSPFMNRYNSLHKLTNSENKYMESINYGLTRQHNLSSHAALNCNNLNFLDNRSFVQFLEDNTKYNQTKNSATNARFDNPRFLQKTISNDLKIGTTTTSQPLNSNTTLNTAAEGSILDTLNYLQLSGETQMSWGLVDELFLNSNFTGRTDHLDWANTQLLGTSTRESFTDGLLTTSTELSDIIQTTTNNLNKDL